MMLVISTRGAAKRGQTLLAQVQGSYYLLFVECLAFLKHFTKSKSFYLERSILENPGQGL